MDQGESFLPGTNEFLTKPVDLDELLAKIGRRPAMIKPLFRSNIRFKLVVSLLSIVLLTGILSTIVGINIINKNVIREAYENVRSSLAATNELYEEEIARRSRTIQYLAKTPEIVRAAAAGDRAALYGRLVQIKKEFAFDIVNVVDPEGKVLVRANAYDAYGDSMAHYRTIQEVVRTRAPAAGTGVLDPENIRFEGPSIVGRTPIPIVPTPLARPRSSPLESRALVIKIAAPILEGGRLRGILYAAVLLNNNSEFIDRFKRLVFKEEKVRGKDVGTTTIFLGDIRVATNVIDSEGRRAIGTQVSEQVYRRVFEEGRVWLDKAFVVNNWYMSGYSPLFDIDHKPLGILYVGILKQKYDLILRGTTLSFLLVICVTILLAIALAVYLINIYTRPLKRIIAASTEMAMGFYHRIEADPRDDDARKLERAFNSMVDALQERDRQLKEQAERTILKSEKLASIGRLASGIAHEINNPLTGVLTYSSLLLEDMKGTKYEEDLKVIRDETLRCRRIVRGILDFARDTEARKGPGRHQRDHRGQPPDPGKARQFPECRHRPGPRPRTAAGQRGRRRDPVGHQQPGGQRRRRDAERRDDLTISTAGGREPGSSSSGSRTRVRHLPGEPGPDVRAVLHHQGRKARGRGSAWRLSTASSAATTGRSTSRARSARERNSRSSCPCPDGAQERRWPENCCSSTTRTSSSGAARGSSPGGGRDRHGDVRRGRPGDGPGR